MTSQMFAAETSERSPATVATRARPRARSVSMMQAAPAGRRDGCPYMATTAEEDATGEGVACKERATMEDQDPDM